MIKSASQKYNPKYVEKKIQKFWIENNIFKKSIDQRKKSKPYVFLEGPPTANGMPHPGHVLTRVMKDLVLRYQAMNGHYILRKAGWRVCKVGDGQVALNTIQKKQPNLILLDLQMHEVWYRHTYYN